MLDNFGPDVKSSSKVNKMELVSMQEGSNDSSSNYRHQICNCSGERDT